MRCQRMGLLILTCRLEKNRIGRRFGFMGCFHWPLGRSVGLGICRIRRSECLLGTRLSLAGLLLLLKMNWISSCRSARSGIFTQGNQDRFGPVRWAQATTLPYCTLDKSAHFCLPEFHTSTPSVSFHWAWPRCTGRRKGCRYWRPKRIT